jgi:hypothetical protein
MDMSAEQLQDSMAQLRMRVIITSDAPDFKVDIRGQNFTTLKVDGKVMIAPKDPKRRSQYEVTGSNHKMIMEDGVLYVASELATSSSKVQYTSTAASQYDITDLLKLQHTSQLTAGFEGALRHAGILEPVRTFSANWRLSFPFADPNLRRKDLYLVPQLLTSTSGQCSTAIPIGCQEPSSSPVHCPRSMPSPTR